LNLVETWCFQSYKIALNMWAAKEAQNFRRTVYRVGFSVFCPTKTVPTFGLCRSGAVFIFFASARAAIFAASWVARAPFRFSTVLSELRIS
jgi:hypothetical protein